MCHTVDDDRRNRGFWRRLTATGVIAASLLALTPGVAHAEPTADEVREEIERLEQEFSELNEAYNKAKEEHEAAQQKLDEINDDLAETEDELGELQESIRILANTAYSGADYDSLVYLIGASDPDEMLAQSADLYYLSQSQQGKLDRYVEQKEKLEQLREEAEATEQEAQDKLDEAEAARQEGEDKIAEQQALLDELTADEQAEATAGINTVSSSSGGTATAGSATGKARIALEFALNQVGKPYIWGGTGPNGYDCSGLTQAAWAAAGVSLPRVSQDQFYAGQRVSWENIQAGDLLFFYDSTAPTHVGMATGDGRMVHASTSSKPISVVELTSYYRQNFVGAVRPA